MSYDKIQALKAAIEALNDGTYWNRNYQYTLRQMLNLVDQYGQCTECTKCHGHEPTCSQETK